MYVKFWLDVEWLCNRKMFQNLVGAKTPKGFMKIMAARMVMYDEILR